MFYSIDANTSCFFTKQNLTLKQAYCLSICVELCNEPKVWQLTFVFSVCYMLYLEITLFCAPQRGQIIPCYVTAPLKCYDVFGLLYHDTQLDIGNISFHKEYEWAYDDNSGKPFHKSVIIPIELCLYRLHRSKLIYSFGHVLTVNSWKNLIPLCSFLKFHTDLEANSVWSFQNGFEKCLTVLNLVCTNHWIFHKHCHILGYKTTLKPNMIMLLVGSQ